MEELLSTTGNHLGCTFSLVLAQLIKAAFVADCNARLHSPSAVATQSAAAHKRPLHRTLDVSHNPLSYQGVRCALGTSCMRAYVFLDRLAFNRSCECRLIWRTLAELHTLCETDRGATRGSVRNAAELDDALAQMRLQTASAATSNAAYVESLAAASPRRCAVTGLRTPLQDVVSQERVLPPTGPCDSKLAETATRPRQLDISMSTSSSATVPLRSVRSDALPRETRSSGGLARHAASPEAQSSATSADEVTAHVQSSSGTLMWPQPSRVVLTGAALLPAARVSVPGTLWLGVDLAPAPAARRASKGAKRKAGKSKASSSKKQKQIAARATTCTTAPASFDVDDLAGLYNVSLAVLADRLVARELLAARERFGHAAVHLEAAIGGESVPVSRLSGLLASSTCGEPKQLAVSVQLKVAAAPLAGHLHREMLPERLAALTADMLTSRDATEAWKVRGFEAGMLWLNESGMWSRGCFNPWLDARSACRGCDVLGLYRQV